MVHVTVDPAGTVITAGWNANPWMFTFVVDTGDALRRRLAVGVTPRAQMHRRGRLERRRPWRGGQRDRRRIAMVAGRHDDAQPHRAAERTDAARERQHMLVEQHER